MKLHNCGTNDFEFYNVERNNEAIIDLGCLYGG